MRRRVLMYPISASQNKVLDILVSALEARGDFEYVNFSYSRSWFQRFDIFHVHWPDAVVYPSTAIRTVIKWSLFIIFIMACGLFNKKIVWTVHNVRAHESRYPLLERIMWSIFIPRVHCFIHMCEQSVSDLEAAYKIKKKGSHFVIPHPNYRGIYRSTQTACEVREKLGFSKSENLFVIFGLLRRYKGIEDAVKQFQEAHLKNSKLLIVGASLPGDSLVDMLRELASSSDNVVLLEGFVDDQAMVDLIVASTSVLLPSRTMLNSGVACLSLSLNRPIIAYPVGCINDYYSKLGPSWVHLITNDLASSLKSFSFEQEENSGEEADMQFSDPGLVASLTIEVYEFSLA